MDDTFTTLPHFSGCADQCNFGKSLHKIKTYKYKSTTFTPISFLKCYLHISHKNMCKIIDLKMLFQTRHGQSIWNIFDSGYKHKLMQLYRFTCCLGKTRLITIVDKYSDFDIFFHDFKSKFFDGIYTTEIKRERFNCSSCDAFSS